MEGIIVGNPNRIKNHSSLADKWFSLQTRRFLMRANKVVDAFHFHQQVAQDRRVSRTIGTVKHFFKQNIKMMGTTTGTPLT